MNQPSFGEQLRAIRFALNLTQIDVWLLSEEIAKREGSADFVVGNSRLSSIENGHALPGPAKLLALGEIYGLTREQLTKLWATIKLHRERLKVSHTEGMDSSQGEDSLREARRARVPSPEAQLSRGRPWPDGSSDG